MRLVLVGELVRGSDVAVHFSAGGGFVPGGRPEMMDEGPADLRELVRLPVTDFPALGWFRRSALAGCFQLIRVF